MSTLDTVRSYDDVVAAFADPSLIVPPIPSFSSSSSSNSFDWLRASVSRFANGDDHDRRRALVETDLAALRPVALRDEAMALSAALIDGAPSHFDLMATVAVVVPVTVLARGLGTDPASTPAVGRAISDVAAGYRDPDAASVHRAADRAVDELLVAFGGERSEAVANRIGLLVQAFDATAGLIGNAAALALRLDRLVASHADRVVRGRSGALRSAGTRHAPSESRRGRRARPSRRQPRCQSVP